MQPDVLATTCFYATDIHKRGLGEGTHDNSLDRIGEITGELLMIWGRQDPHIPREGRALIYNALSDAEMHFQWHEFNAAHAFLRDEGPRYGPAAVRICYDMALELFTRKLGEGDRRAATASTEATHLTRLQCRAPSRPDPLARRRRLHSAFPRSSSFYAWGELRAARVS
jgi:carboxymethylenebutenolidase